MLIKLADSPHSIYKFPREWRNEFCIFESAREITIVEHINKHAAYVSDLFFKSEPAGAVCCREIRLKDGVIICVNNMNTDSVCIVSANNGARFLISRHRQCWNWGRFELRCSTAENVMLGCEDLKDDDLPKVMRKFAPL